MFQSLMSCCGGSSIAWHFHNHLPQSTLFYHSCSFASPNDVTFWKKCLCYSLQRTEGNSPAAECDPDAIWYNLNIQVRQTSSLVGILLSSDMPNRWVWLHCWNCHISEGGINLPHEKVQCPLTTEFYRAKEGVRSWSQFDFLFDRAFQSHEQA